MSDEDRPDNEEEGTQGLEPGAPEPAKLRRRPFGYKRSDVDEAMGTRDAQLAELRQDIAALWLAFAQHDRMIRDLAGGEGAPRTVAAPEPEAPPASEEAPPVSPPPTDPGAEDAEIARQLTDLDEVLAAIEMATQTLERSYAEEIAEPGAEASGAGTEEDEAPG